MLRNAAPMLALGALVALGPGCRSFSEGMLRRPQPAPIIEPTDHSIREFIDEHNRQVGLVDSVQVRDLNVRAHPSGRDRPQLLPTRLHGVMLVERPKNLRILLNHPAAPQRGVDIGSNAEGFWFSNPESREMVVGRYAEMAGQQDPLASSIDPDWILEVLNLRRIPESVEVRPGPSEASRTLVEHRRESAQVELVKETVVDLQSGQILEHRLYTPDRQLLAQATVRRYQSVSLGSGDEASALNLPSQTMLKIPEMADLDLTLAGLKLNPPEGFTAESFTQPDKSAEGYAVLDIRAMLEPSTSYAATNPASQRSEAVEPIPEPEQPPAVEADRDVARVVDLGSALPSRKGETAEQPVEPRAYYETPVPSGQEPVQRVSTWRAQPGNRFPRDVLGRD